MAKAYYASMPLLVNIPAGRPEWELTICPTCGSPCWERPRQHEEARKRLNGDVYFVCTECMLKYGKGRWGDE